MIRNPHLRLFLGLDRFKELWDAWHATNRQPVANNLSSIAIIFTIIVALLPALAFNMRDYFHAIDEVTIAIGIATCLAVLFRVNSRIPFLKVPNWRRALSITHTAFALGCIPLILVLLFYPEGLQILTSRAVEHSREGGVIQANHLDALLFILKVAVWAGLTEEFIFRGMLISAIRRWNLIKTQRARDITAVIFSATIFGLSHFASWGPTMSFVLIALGVGFGIAYIAIGELLLPLIVYHILFDILSLSLSIYLKF
jgi:membrane protease YdiL (CAAX protease family)